MAQVIEFYIPVRFKPKVKWVPVEQRGKIIAFPSDTPGRSREPGVVVSGPPSPGSPAARVTRHRRYLIQLAL